MDRIPEGDGTPSIRCGTRTQNGVVVVRQGQRPRNPGYLACWPGKIHIQRQSGIGLSLEEHARTPAPNRERETETTTTMGMMTGMVLRLGSRKADLSRPILFCGDREM